MFRRAEEFRDRKVLVAGASGFLGTHLCARLVQGGAAVYATSRSARTDPVGELDWRQVDLTDIDAVRELLVEVRPDIVFHLSGLTTAKPDLELVLPIFSSALTSTVNLLTVATEIGSHRVVLAGSLTEPVPDLGAEAVPGSPYAAAKWASSTYARMFHALYRTPIVIVRPFMTFGPGQEPGKIIPYSTLSLLQGEAPKLSSGRWQADWIYVDDVIEGMLAAAHREEAIGRTLELGSGTCTAVRTIVEQLVELTGSSAALSFGAVADRPSEQVRTADIAHTRDVLGWEPKTSLREGLARTVEWFRNPPAQYRALMR